MKLLISFLFLGIATLYTLFLTEETHFSFNNQTPPAQSKPKPPVPPNPYCNISPVDPPIPQCPEGQTMDVVCVENCKNAYRATVQAAYDQACTDYNTATSNWQDGMTLLLNDYRLCLKYANTPAKILECQNNYFEGYNTLYDTLTAAIDAINQSVANTEQAALDTFNACALACCHE